VDPRQFRLSKVTFLGTQLVNGTLQGYVKGIYPKHSFVTQGRVSMTEVYLLQAAEHCAESSLVLQRWRKVEDCA
jgi:hypothetical protein